ncbi:hypothetical protein IKO50_02915 [bacterium]|nr:hypothetical protein [bacterium]
MLIVLIVIACILVFIAVYLVKINKTQNQFKELWEYYVKAICQNSKLIAYFTETPEYKEMKDKAIEKEIHDEFEAVFNKDKKKTK